MKRRNEVPKEIAASVPVVPQPRGHGGRLLVPTLEVGSSDDLTTRDPQSPPLYWVDARIGGIYDSQVCVQLWRGFVNADDDDDEEPPDSFTPLTDKGEIYVSCSVGRGTGDDGIPCCELVGDRIPVSHLDRIIYALSLARDAAEKAGMLSPFPMERRTNLDDWLKADLANTLAKGHSGGSTLLAPEQRQELRIRAEERRNRRQK